MDFVENIWLFMEYGFGCELIMNVISAGKTIQLFSATLIHVRINI